MLYLILMMQYDRRSRGRWSGPFGGPRGLTDDFGCRPMRELFTWPTMAEREGKNSLRLGTGQIGWDG